MAGRVALAGAIGLWALAPGAGFAETSFIAARTLPAGTIIAPGDVTALAALDDPDGDARLLDVVGRQARTTIYEGKAVQPANLAKPTLVERNALVTVIYTAGGLSISTEGRALGRGGAGDAIAVLNVASRVTLTALINPDGTLSVVARP